MEYWILPVLILILIVLLRLETRAGELVDELKLIQEQFCWVKDNNFAGHLFQQLAEHCKSLEREMTGLSNSLDRIEDRLYTANSSLDGLEKIALTVGKIEDQISSASLPGHFPTRLR